MRPAARCPPSKLPDCNYELVKLCLEVPNSKAFGLQQGRLTSGVR
jgi:hypothetical protein